MKQQNNTVSWSDDVHRLFRQHKIKMVSFVPDGGLKKLIKLCEGDSDMQTVTLTTEEEGEYFPLTVGCHLLLAKKEAR